MEIDLAMINNGPFLARIIAYNYFFHPGRSGLRRPFGIKISSCLLAGQPAGQEEDQSQRGK
jgi:hypothetical protein